MDSLKLDGLKWGKPTIEIRKIVASPNTGEWKKLDTPVENTTKLTTAKGNKKEAIVEGGGVVGVRYGESKYTVEFELFAKGNSEKPMIDVNGTIAGDYEVRIIPEDTSLPGKLIDVVKFSVEDSFDAENGEKWKYTGDVMKPATGSMLKPYFANALVVAPTALYFANTADTAGKTVAVTSTAVPTVESSDAWCTASVASKVVTVKTTANTGNVARTATVTITADGKTSAIVVTQIPA